MLKIFLQLMTAFFWHVYRFLTFRPSLVSFGDTRFNFGLFTACFFALGFLRHSGLFGGFDPEPWQGEHFFWRGFFILGLGLLSMYFFFALFFIRQGRSKVLFMGIIFSSCSIDVLAIVGQLLSLPTLFEAALMPYEVVLYFVVVKTFNALPDRMKEAGFRPAKAGGVQ